MKMALAENKFDHYILKFKSDIIGIEQLKYIN